MDGVSDNNTGPWARHIPPPPADIDALRQDAQMLITRYPHDTRETAKITLDMSSRLLGIVDHLQWARPLNAHLEPVPADARLIALLNRLDLIAGSLSSVASGLMEIATAAGRQAELVLSQREDVLESGTVYPVGNGKYAVVDGMGVQVGEAHDSPTRAAATLAALG